MALHKVILSQNGGAGGRSMRFADDAHVIVIATMLPLHMSHGFMSADGRIVDAGGGPGEHVGHGCTRRMVLLDCQKPPGVSATL